MIHVKHQSRLAAAMVFSLALSTAGASRGEAEPQEWGGLGGAILVGATACGKLADGSQPCQTTLVAAYPVAAWSSLCRRCGGQGTLVALVNLKLIGLMLGHRFSEVDTGGQIASLTVGPVAYLRFDDSSLRATRFGLSAVLSLRRKETK